MAEKKKKERSKPTPPTVTISDDDLANLPDTSPAPAASPKKAAPTGGAPTKAGKQQTPQSQSKAPGTRVSPPAPTKGTASGFKGSLLKPALPPSNAFRKVQAYPTSSGASWALRASTDHAAMKSECAAVINNPEYHQMYQVVEQGLMPQFRLNIEAARIDSEATKDSSSNAIYLFKDGEERVKIESTEAMRMELQINMNLAELMNKGDLELQSGGVLITGIHHIPETGALRIKCANKLSAAWFVRNLGTLIPTDKLKVWDQDKDTQYRFTAYVPSFLCAMQTEALIKFIKNSNPGRMDWLRVPTVGLYPHKKYKCFDIVFDTKTEADQLKDLQHFRLGTNYGMISPAKTEPPPVSIKEGAEVYKKALYTHRKLLKPGEVDPYAKYQSDEPGYSMTQLTREARSPIASPNIVELMGKLKESKTKFAIEKSEDDAMLSMTLDGLNKLAKDEQKKTEGKLRHQPLFRIEDFPADYVPLDKKEVFLQVERAQSEGATKVDLEKAVAQMAELVDQELKEARLRAKETLDKEKAAKEAPKPNPGKGNGTKRAASVPPGPASAKRTKTPKGKIIKPPTKGGKKRQEIEQMDTSGSTPKKDPPASE